MHGCDLGAAWLLVVAAGMAERPLLQAVSDGTLGNVVMPWVTFGLGIRSRNCFMPHFRLTGLAVGKNNFHPRRDSDATGESPFWRFFIVYQPIENWISLDRDTSPTTASGNMYNALVAAGAKPVNLGQGREIVELPLLQKLTIEAFEQAIKGGKLLHSKYGAPSVELNAASAAWLQRIMNVDATKDTTFTLENQGRGGLYAAFHLLASLAAFRKDGRIVVPDTSWPMVSDQLNDFQLKPTLYTMTRGRYADHIRAQLEAHGDAVVGVYVNSPHNPTGTLLTKADFEQIFARNASVS
jgi:hypothetical protein